jgi:nitroreductase
MLFDGILCLSLLPIKRIKGMKIKTFVLCAMLVSPIGMWAQSEQNEVINTIMARRSVRKYQAKPVEHAKLETIAKCGINAPNGMNSQKWEVRVVEDPKFIEETTALFVKDNPEMVKRDKNFKNMYRNAPNIICIGTPGGEASVDAGLLGENIILAAQSLGLGTCCLGGPVRFLVTSEAAKPYIERLGFSEGYGLCYIIAVGYSDEAPEAKPRDESKIVFIK